MRVVNKALAAILLIFLLVPAPLISADQEDETEFKTGVFATTMMNGKAWIRLDQQSKIMYLTGIENGVNLLIAEMDSAPNEEGNARAALPASKRLMIKGFRFSDITEEIDRFYEQASNRRIPVVDAYRYVLKKFKGSSPEELATVQTALRKKYNK